MRTLSLIAIGLSLTLSAAALLVALSRGGETFGTEPAARDRLREEIRAYILEEPELLLEATERLEEKYAALAAQETIRIIDVREDEIFYDAHSFVGGNPDGDVTIVEFLDYNCPYCRQAHPVVRELLESDGGLRYVVKEFPVLGAGSRFAARAALALRARDDTLYPAFADAMMESDASVTRETVLAIAAEQGIDPVWLEGAADDPALSALIRQNLDLAEALGVTGTPSFVIGRRLFSGYVTLDTLRAAVEESRAAAARAAP